MDELTVDYTKKEYETSTTPYERLDQTDDPFQRQILINLMREDAKKKGANFTTTYSAYKKSAENFKEGFVESDTYFIEKFKMTFELGTSWSVDEDGIYYLSKRTMSAAFPHPIFPVAFYYNVETGDESVELAFLKNGRWRKVICAKEQIAAANKIVGLAKKSIMVTSENAKDLVKFLNEMESINHDIIPYYESVSHYGWVDGDRFVPYTQGLIFDCGLNDNQFGNVIKHHGSKDEWMKKVKELRKVNKLPTRIVFAASFASVLIKRSDALSFVVHMWGGSENGKSVSMMMAASVWGNPEIGKYPKTFRCTPNAMEKLAATYHSLPFFLDELSLEDVNEKKNFDRIVYYLAEGSGKERLNRDGTLQPPTTWNNCTISTGEQPLTSGSSNAGAVNRIIDIDCTKEYLFADPRGLAGFFKKNYGFAGEEFVALIKDGTIDLETINFRIKHYFDRYSVKFTQKQALAAATIMAADELIEAYIFKDGQRLKPDEIEQYLADRDEMSQGLRGFDWLMDWLEENKSHFTDPEAKNGVYGTITDAKTYIIKSVFERACRDAGFNSKMLLKWLKENDKSEYDTGRLDSSRRIGNLGGGRKVVLKNCPFEISSDEQEKF